MKTMVVNGRAYHFQIRWPFFTTCRGHCLCDINAVLADLNRKYSWERRLGRAYSMSTKVVVNTVSHFKRRRRY